MPFRWLSSITRAPSRRSRREGTGGYGRLFGDEDDDGVDEDPEGVGEDDPGVKVPKALGSFGDAEDNDGENNGAASEDDEDALLTKEGMEMPKALLLDTGASFSGG